MSASLVSTRHLNYHERHAFSELARLREIRLGLAQMEKYIERQPATFNRDMYLEAARRTRSSVEMAIIALNERNWHSIYDYLRRAQVTSLGLPPAGGDVHYELDQAIADWRPR